MATITELQNELYRIKKRLCCVLEAINNGEGGVSVPVGTITYLGDVYDINNNTDVVFPDPPSSIGGAVEFASTFSNASSLSLEAGTWVRVATDETNNGDKSMYLYTGTELEFQYTIS